MNPSEFPLRQSSLLAESPMQASKWLQIQALIDAEEMRALFDHLGDFAIYLAGSLTTRDAGSLSKSQFLTVYEKYAAALKNGQIPDAGEFRAVFSAVFSLSPQLLYAIPVENGKQLIRVSRPVVQLQAHSMDYTIYDEKFRPMVFGLDSILWGLQFSYPQLYLDPATKEVLQVNESDFFPNTRLFRDLQKWIRHQTIPTPFLVGSKQINVPMRLGKQCKEWINRHPQLLSKNIKVL